MNSYVPYLPNSRRILKNQQGQALVWLLATVATAGALLFAVYNTGQLHVAKAKTVNTADAAALAGAQVQARILNLIAYNNRSMVANEVFLVQALSLESWLGYFSKTAENVGTVVDVIAFFFPVFKPVGKLLDEVGSEAKNIREKQVRNGINGIIAAMELSKAGFSVAHDVVYRGGGLMAESAAKTIVQASRSIINGRTDWGAEIDQRYGVRAVTFIANQERWLSFVKQYKDNDRKDAKEVVLASRDNFSTSRPGQPWFNASAIVAGTTKLGGTQLHGFERWESQDTFELWTMSLKGREYIPIGWGRSNADAEGTTRSHWDPNRQAQDEAFDDGKYYSHENWKGIPNFFDLRSKNDKETVGIDFIVALGRPKSSTLTTLNLTLGAKTSSRSGSSEVEERLHEDRLGAIAKARASFERPRRSDNDKTAISLFRGDSAKEYASLYSPYWQARLKDFGKFEKGALVSAMGVDPRNVLITPGAQE